MQLFNHGGTPRQRLSCVQTNTVVRAAKQHVELQILGLAYPCGAAR
jgi:hypothetical protein